MRDNPYRSPNEYDDPDADRTSAPSTTSAVLGLVLYVLAALAALPAFIWALIGLGGGGGVVCMLSSIVGALAIVLVFVGRRLRH